MNSHASNRAQEGRQASQLHQIAAAQDAKRPSLTSANAGSEDCEDTGRMETALHTYSIQSTNYLEI